MKGSISEILHNEEKQYRFKIDSLLKEMTKV